MLPPVPDRAAQILPMGLSGLLVRFADRLDDGANRAALAFRAALEAAAPPGVEETAASIGAVFLRFDPAVTDAAALAATLAELLAARDWRAAPLPAGRRLWTVPAVFDGPDLATAADLAGLTPESAAEELAAARLRVLAIGFAPGLAYMGPLPLHWDIPRQRTLTPVAPAAAIAIAVRQLIIFPTATPTGWRQVGRTGFRIFRPGTARPFALAAGDELRFRPVSGAELTALIAADPEGGGSVAEPIP
ncbi:MAG: carboxyltransferase domain-containing protein [Albidovulum sp.]